LASIPFPVPLRTWGTTWRKVEKTVGEGKGEELLRVYWKIYNPPSMKKTKIGQEDIVKNY